MHILKRGLPFLVLAIFLINANGICQTTNNNKKNSIIISKGRPNIPGELGFDFGLTVAPGFNDSLKLNTIRCWYISPFYKYEFFIPKTKFSILTGISLGLEKYRFKNPVTIMRDQNNKGEYYDHVTELSSLVNTTSIKQTKLAINYLEIPLELRFRTNATYPKNSFTFSAGAKIGWVFNAHTKYKYRQEGIKKTVKNRDQFDLNPFRYGYIIRVGYGDFSLFYYQSLSPIFKTGKEPEGTVSEPINAGISFSVF